MAIRIEHTYDNPTAAAGKKLAYIKSYGCQMNVYDAIRMGELLGPHGYHLADNPNNADLVIYNTCHIREKADDKLFSDIGRFTELAKPKALHAVGGCIGQAMGEDVIKREYRVNIVFGPQTFHRLPEFIEKANRSITEGKRPRVVDIELPELEKFDQLPSPGAHGPTAFITIQEGCNKFCTYCVVPYTRGEEISRPLADILTESAALTQQGVKEITLIGQNVNAYDGADAQGNIINFAQLIKAVAKVDGVERIRFTTSHPFNMDNELIELFREGVEPKLMPYLHLPVQAGSDKILAAMNRTHTAQEYLDIIAQVKTVRPDIALAGDFIVGFPDETEDDFAQTLAVAEQTNYASAYSFAFSARPGTPAANLPNHIEKPVQMERLERLQTLLNSQQKQFTKQFTGKTVQVLVENKAIKGEGMLHGKTPHNISVTFKGGERLIGEIVNVAVTNVYDKHLVGTVI